MSVPAHWIGVVDDAAIFPPGDAELSDAVRAWQLRAEEWYAGLVGSFVITDTRLGELARLGSPPVSVVVTGGAGAIGPALDLAARRDLRVHGVEIALRDLDDLPGNARRVGAAVLAAAPDDVAVFVEIPGPVTPSWLRAADEVAAADHRLKLRLGHVDHDLIPDSATVAGWLDAALERELAVKGTAGLHRAVRHPPEGGGAHGFLNLLLATRAAYDGATAADLVPILDQTDPDALVAQAAATDLAGARRWFTAFGSCSVTEPLDDLLALGLLEAPA